MLYLEDDEEPVTKKPYVRIGQIKDYTSSRRTFSNVVSE